MAERPRGTVTFLFTDIEGSTRLWQQQPEVMRKLLARHDALLRATIEQAGGRVFKMMGDACYARFDRPETAVHTAVAAQRLLRQEVPELRVRSALHAGEAEERDGDYFGPALNQLARPLAAGYGGQILLPSAVAEATRHRLPAPMALRPLGTHRLRNIEDTESIFQLQPPGLAGRFPPLNTLNVAARRGALRADVWPRRRGAPPAGSGIHCLRTQPPFTPGWQTWLVSQQKIEIGPGVPSGKGGICDQQQSWSVGQAIGTSVGSSELGP
jgi:class 3 adenylate cyclase